MQIIKLYSSPSICIFKINLYITVFYWTRSHSLTGLWGCRSTVLLPNKKSGREVQPLTALYPTVRLSPWRQVRKNIHSRVSTPGHTWSVLHPGGTPSWFPLIPSDWGVWTSPSETDQDPCPGWLPPVSLNRVWRASLLVPLHLELSASLPPGVAH